MARFELTYARGGDSKISRQSFVAKLEQDVAYADSCSGLRHQSLNKTRGARPDQRVFGHPDHAL